jgi:hypothetical protein
MITGSGNMDTVQESSADAAFLARHNVELRAGSGLHYGDRLSLLGRCGSVLIRLRLDVAFLVILLFGYFFGPKALNIGN